MKKLIYADTKEEVETVSGPEYLADEAVVVAKTTGRAVEIIKD